jgi:hypothetical protein
MRSTKNVAGQNKTGRKTVLQRHISRESHRANKRRQKPLKLKQNGHSSILATIPQRKNQSKQGKHLQHQAGNYGQSKGG